MLHIQPKPTIFLLPFLLLLCAASSQLQAQNNYTIELYGLQRGTLSPNDIWTLNLNNPTPGTREAYIYASIVDDKDGEVVQITSFPFEMPPGISQVSSSFIGTHEIIYLSSRYQNAIENYEQFPRGNYTICVKLMVFNHTMANDCVTHKVTKELPATPSTQPKPQRQTPQNTRPSPIRGSGAQNDELEDGGGFSISGDMNVYGFYSDNNAIAPAYLQTEFNPVFSFGSVPFRGHALFTTNDLAHENSILGNHRRISGGNFRYDYFGYRNNMLKRLQKRMANDRNKAARPKESEKAELARLKAFFNDPAVQKERALLQSLDKGDLNYNVSVAERNMGELQRKKELYKTMEARIKTLEKRVGSSDSKKAKLAALDWGSNATLKEKLRQYGLYAGAHKLWFNIRELGFGDLYPSLSPLTLYGTRVTGAHFAINPGAFYLELAGGHTRGGILSKAGDQAQSGEYKRTLGVVRMGLGQPERTHLYATFMPSRDLSGSLDTAAVNALGITPQLNLIMGLEGQISLWQNKMRLFGEF